MTSWKNEMSKKGVKKLEKIPGARQKWAIFRLWLKGPFENLEPRKFLGSKSHQILLQNDPQIFASRSPSQILPQANINTGNQTIFLGPYGHQKNTLNANLAAGKI
jgi:hypothetical protein